MKPLALKQSEYDSLCKTVYQFSRINLGANKKELVSSRLAGRIRKLNLKSFGQYCDLIKSDRGRAELTHLIDAISTNHTYFFRENAHFDFLKNTVLTDLKKLNQNSLRIWSAACSSGEEAYTIAILLEEERKKQFQNLNWQIECTDISTKILRTAADGVFKEDRLKELKPALIKSYFQKGTGDWAGHYRGRKDLRDRMRFTHMNLCNPAINWHQPFDVVFLRNVMIYFDKSTQEELVNRINKFIKPGGYLFVGHSESLTNINHDYESIQPSVYRKK